MFLIWNQYFFISNRSYLSDILYIERLNFTVIFTVHLISAIEYGKYVHKCDVTTLEPIQQNKLFSIFAKSHTCNEFAYYNLQEYFKIISKNFKKNL